MTGTSVPDVVLAGVDRAAFAASFAARLRAAGVPTSMTNVATFTHGLSAVPLDRLSRVYWISRVCLVSRLDDIGVFDRVFAAVFDDTVLAADPNARRRTLATTDPPLSSEASPARGDAHSGDALPWITLPVMGMVPAPIDDEVDADEHLVPELRASAKEALADVPFDELSDDDIAALGRWLERTLPVWPARRSRRVAAHPSGRRVALRRTLSRARRTGWEAVELLRDEPTERPRRLVIVLDVSESMRAYATAMLTLMRVAVRSADAEVFAFATRLTRLTAALGHRSTASAIDLATDLVSDRFGGTRIATNLRSLMKSRHGDAIRGAIVVIASDGWDSDPPDELGAAMVWLRRRAHRVVWLNPRAASPGFEPKVGAMAAALPHCDEFLPAHTFVALAEALQAFAGPPVRSKRAVPAT